MRSHAPATSRRSGPSARSVPPSVSIMRTNPSAAPYGQSRPWRNSSWTTLAIVVVSEPPSRSGVTKSPMAGMNVRIAGGDDPGHRQRQRDVDERRPAAGVEVAARGDERRIEPVDRDEQRQDRERQEAVGHPEDHREVGVQQDDRLVRQADGLEERIERRRCRAGRSSTRRSG